MPKGTTVNRKIYRQFVTQMQIMAIIICPDAHPIAKTIGVEAREV